MTNLERDILRLLKRPLHRLAIFEKLPFGTAEAPNTLPLIGMAAKGWLILRQDGRWTLTSAGRKALEAGQ